MLNALDLKCSMIHSSIARLFVCVGWNGILSGVGGTDVLRGQPHGVLFFSFAEKLFSDSGVGKSGGIRPRSFRAVFDR